MSTYGVRTRFVNLLVRGRDRVGEGPYRALVDYARDRGFTSGELKALLQPADYLETSAVLRAHGIGLTDIRVVPAALALAEELARELGQPPPFARMPGARPAAPTPPPPPPPPAG